MGKTLRARIRIPLLLSIISLLGTFVYLWTSTPLYEARVTITGRAEEKDSLQALASGIGLGMFSSLTSGVTLSNYDKLVEVLTSADTAAYLKANNDLLARLMPERWDATRMQWKRPTGLAARARSMLNRMFGLPAWTQPSVEPLMDLMERRLRVVANNGGRSHTISFRHSDPAVARETLESILNAADNLLQERHRQLVEENVAFLRDRMHSETLVEVRTVLSRQLGEQFIRSAMLANSGPYAYEILENFRVSSNPVSPRPALAIILALLAGLITGTALVLLLPPNGRPPARETSPASHPVD